VPDDQLEKETDRVSRRSASLDKLAIAEIKPSSMRSRCPTTRSCRLV